MILKPKVRVYLEVEASLEAQGRAMRAAENYLATRNDAADKWNEWLTLRTGNDDTATVYALNRCAIIERDAQNAALEEAMRLFPGKKMRVDVTLELMDESA